MGQDFPAGAREHGSHREGQGEAVATRLVRIHALDLLVGHLGIRGAPGDVLHLRDSHGCQLAGA